MQFNKHCFPTPNIICYYTDNDDTIYMLKLRRSSNIRTSRYDDYYDIVRNKVILLLTDDIIARVNNGEIIYV